MRRHDPDTRALIALRFRDMYRSAGMSRANAAQFFQVSERTLHNWESGRHDIPYTAYRLIRLHRGYELPGKAWDGWTFTDCKLYTPEGHGMDPRTANWWSMLVRRAETGSKALVELNKLRERLAGGAGAFDAEHEGGGAAGQLPIRRSGGAQRR